MNCLWNHPTLMYLRQTINRGGQDPMCDFCQSRDTISPLANDDMASIQRAMDSVLLHVKADMDPKEIEARIPERVDGIIR